MPSNADLQIQPAGEADIQPLSRLFDQYRQFYGCEADLLKAEHFISARMAAGDSRIFVARRGDEICGFVQCYPGFASLECRPSWLLSDLFVVAEVRRHGVGRAMLAQVKEAAEAADCCLVELFTAKTNGVAQNLYESAGYKEDREFLHYELML